ncbi:MAG: hypothetical protein ABSB89_04045 [Candidatus Bathyarchaeia archaeon]|jgi:hypothetical protein
MTSNVGPKGKKPTEVAEKMKSSNVIPLWADQYPEVKRWLAKLQDKTMNAFSLYRFCEWAAKTPSELLKMETSNKEVEKLLDELVSTENVGFTNAVKFHLITAVKSFFKHNYIDLAKASGALNVEKVRPYNMPRKADLRKLWNWALNPRDKSLITFVCSTAIAKETISRIQWKHLEEGWEKIDLPCINIPPELLKGHGIGRYKDVRQITFLTPEAKRDLLNYKEWVESRMRRRLTPEDHIFLSAQSPYGPLKYGHMGKLMWSLAKEAGVTFNWHDARRYVNTAMEEIRMPPNWARKIRGRKVRGEEAPYSRPAIDQLRSKFAEAVQILEFTSEIPTVTFEFSERLKALEKFKESLSPDQRDAAKRAGIQLRDAENVGKVLRAKRPKGQVNKQKEDCPDGEHCQKLVTETELTECLKNGWKVVTSLASGKIVVEH